MSECRACRAPIVWGSTSANGRPMPLNPATDDPLANCHLEDGRITVYGQRPLLAPAGGTWHFPHHMTCPAADELRVART